MSVSIRNENYDYFLEQAYSFYDVKRTPQNYTKALEYAIKLSIISSFNKLFSIFFFIPSDIVVFEDISSNAIQCCQHMINRVVLEAGTNIDQYLCYKKYLIIMAEFEVMMNDMRKQIHDNFINNRSNKFRLARKAEYQILLDL